MANQDRTLVLAFEAKLDKLQKDVDKGLRVVVNKLDRAEAAGSKAFKKMENTAGGSFSRIAAFATKAFAAIGGAAVIKSLIDRVGQAAKRLDELGDTANRLGTTAGDLVKWQSALETTAGSMDGFNASAEAFQGKIGAFIGGIGKTKAIAAALAQIGISREQIGTLSSLEDRLLLIADALSKVEDRAVRAAIADKLGLRPMLPLLEEGRAGIEKLIEKFEGVGRAAQAGVDATGDLADRIALLQKELEYKADNMFVRLAPIIASIYQGISNLIDLFNNPAFQWAMGSALPGFQIGAGLAGMRDSAADMREELAGLEKDLQGLEIGGVNASDAAYRRIKLRADTLKAELGALASADASGMTGAPRGYTPAKPKSLVVPDAGEGEDGVKGAAKALKDAATEAERAAKETERLSKAAKSVGIKLFGDNADKQMEQLEIATAAAEDLAQKQADFKEGFRQDFRNVVDDLLRGDLQGAAQTLGDAFAGRAIDKLSDMAFDMLWDGGFGDTMTSLFGDADLAQADLAITTQAATTALGQLTSAALAAATAMGGGGAGNTGSWLSKAISAVTGSIGGGSSIPFPKAWAAGGPAQAGEWGMVGEHGPELVKFGRAASVVPAMDTAKLMRGGGPSVTLSIDMRGSTQEAVPALVARVDQLERNLPEIVRRVSNDGVGRGQIRSRR